MPRQVLTAIVIVLALAFCQVAGADDSDARWEMVKGDEGFAIAVPKGWTTLDKYAPSVLLYRQSDGTGGIPKKDEAGHDVQVQLIVEKIQMKPDLENSANVVAARIIEQPGTQIIRRPIGESFKLADGKDAFWMSMELVRGDSRTVVIKMLSKIDSDNGYVVTGTISAGKDSNIATVDGKFSKWLGAITKSFVQDASKSDGSKVDAAYKELDKKD